MTDPITRARKEKIFFAVASPVLWLIACILPAYSDGTSGAGCLLFGWSTFYEGKAFAFIAWFANLPWVVAWFFFLFGKSKKKQVAAIVLSLTAALCTSGAFTVSEIHDGVYGTGGSKYVHPTYGTYAWIASFAILLLGTIAQRFNQKEIDASVP